MLFWKDSFPLGSLGKTFVLGVWAEGDARKLLRAWHWQGHYGTRQFAQTSLAQPIPQRAWRGWYGILLQLPAQLAYEQAVKAVLLPTPTSPGKFFYAVNAKDAATMVFFVFSLKYFHGLAMKRLQKRPDFKWGSVEVSFWLE